MQIFLIALLVGVVFTLVTLAAFNSLKDWELQKSLKGKVLDSAGMKRKGLTGNLFFLASKIGERLKRCRSSYLENTANRVHDSLGILGEPYSRIEPYTFIGIQVLCALGVIVVALIVLEMYNPLGLVLAGASGLFLPYAYIRQKVKDKHKAIFRQIPDVLDLLCLMMDAGLDFNTALNKILGSESGALVSELFLAQQEVKLGKPRPEAYADMAERLKYPPLNTVVNSINLALKTGGSITPALKALSEQFRTERAQLAEKLAAEAPLKLMAPLVLLIFPTIFIILFGPILLSFMGK